MLFSFENARKGGGDGGFSIAAWRDTCRLCEEVDKYEDEEFWKRTAKVGYTMDFSIGMTGGYRSRWNYESR